MTGYTETTVVISGFDDNIMKKFSKVSLIVGGLLLLVGLTGILAPQILSLVASAFLGWLFLIGGALSLYFAFLARWRSAVAWIKPVLLLLAGFLILLNPLAGVVAIALLLAFYLFLDAFASFALARFMKPAKGWGWMASNGVISVALALLLVFAWPADSAVLVGLYLGISLMFDGLSLLLLGLASRQNG